ncbi:WD40-repeat-containing domain protein [Crassisporium funariophilum]|nr:WD40-repeat-containing domain protein [Crassisporium funariophilum]
MNPPRKLEAHTSCVNALAFSSGDGRFLASGGDDLRICLWDFHQDDIKSPSIALRGPKGNIFCLEFSANNRYLFSGGTSETVLKYDIAYLESDVKPSASGRDSIRAITCHPVQDEVFMSASEDGKIRRHDGRSNHDRTTKDTLHAESEITGVQYHPTIDHLFVTSDGIGRVFLRDTRMAFGPLTKRSNEGIVQRYNTKLTRKGTRHLCNPESNSVIFDKEGFMSTSIICMHYQPTIYALSDPDPLAVLSGANLPDGTPNPPNQRTYINSCTMKHGSFGSPDSGTDDLYAGGSDDFRGYVWRIPPLAQLEQRRKVFSKNEWGSYESLSTIAFTESHFDQKIVPVEIATPLCRLTGHKSIVNTVLFHPHLLHIVTAGVERNIVLHSPTPSSPCTEGLQPSPLTVRTLEPDDGDDDRLVYLSALTGIRPLNVESEDDAAERQTLSLFDHILREEGDDVDVFRNRRWRSPGSSDDEVETEEDDEDSDSHARLSPFYYLT